MAGDGKVVVCSGNQEVLINRLRAECGDALQSGLSVVDICGALAVVGTMFDMEMRRVCLAKDNEQAQAGGKGIALPSPADTLKLREERRRQLNGD